MQITGKIIASTELKSGVSAKGNNWRSQQFVADYYEGNSQYSKKVVFDVIGDDIDHFGLQVGEDYKIDIDVNAREYNGKWYNSLRAWRVESVSKKDDVSAPSNVPTQPNASQGSPDQTTDVPF